MNDILIVGNNPSADLNLIKSFSEFVILGRAIFHINEPIIDKWVTRQIIQNSYHINNINNIYIVSDSLVDEYDIKYPTLGYYAISYFMMNSYNVHFTGITLDLNSSYVNIGTWWNTNDIRDNSRHNILKEIVALNQYCYEGRITQL